MVRTAGAYVGKAESSAVYEALTMRLSPAIFDPVHLGRPYLG